MCTTCGCSDTAHLTVTAMTPLTAGKDHGAHEHHPRDARTIALEQDVLGRNNSIAEQNRQWFAEHQVLALNLMSSPGAGKTALLEKTLQARLATLPMAVIEGDQHTLDDARRIRQTGAAVVQLNTAAGCHLEADMVQHGLQALPPMGNGVVVIENVGNLVCPALFDLGEHARVVIISVTEGDNKPSKYPYMFRGADLVIINKIDLLPYVDFDLAACRKRLAAINPTADVLELSATAGTGLAGWYDWIDARCRQI